MKKWLMLLSSGLLLSACSSNAENTTAPNDITPEEQTVHVAVEGETQVNNNEDNKSSSKSDEMIQKTEKSNPDSDLDNESNLIDEYEENHPGIDEETRAQPTESKEQTNNEEISKNENSETQTDGRVDEEKPASDISDQSVTELENYALEQVTSQTGHLSEDYTYFSTLKEDGWVNVEIRSSHSGGETTWTNLVGLYRYNVETNQMETMDPLTGEFE